jgi:hypothetical protein
MQKKNSDPNLNTNAQTLNNISGPKTKQPFNLQAFVIQVFGAHSSVQRSKSKK